MHQHHHAARQGVAYLFLVWPLRLAVGVLASAGYLAWRLCLWSWHRTKRLLSVTV